METEIGNDSFIVTSKGHVSEITTCPMDSFSVLENETTMKLVLEDYAEMSFRFVKMPKYEELSRRHFPHSCIQRPIYVSIEFPLVTEYELQIEAERKRKIAELKADIKNKESHLKALEAVDRRKRYGY